MIKMQRLISKWLNGLLLLGGMAVVGIGPIFDLPPRPPDNPPEISEPVTPSGSVASGSKIMLHAQAATFDGDDWTVIEWQTADGRWVEVDGWQGTFFSQDGMLQVEWWVGPDQLGSGPYRWVVYPNQLKGTQEFVSAPFYLPSASGQAMAVDQ